jgi:predicted small metal-binding protein
MKKFMCCDCGFDCSFEVTGTNENQMTHKIIDHMHTAHNMDSIPAETMLKILQRIRTDEPASSRQEKGIQTAH